jgi:sRNA-binding protein
LKIPADIQALCERILATYPNAPFADRQVPLQVGIRQNLIEIGVLNADEANQLLRWWCGRGGYNLACIEGATRIGLDGAPAGTVSADEAAHSLARLRSRTPSQAAWDAALARAREIRLAREGNRAPHPFASNGSMSVTADRPKASEPSMKSRSSLRDLKTAAVARKTSSSGG